MEKYVDCHNCQNQYDCERTYLGGCTDGKEWENETEKAFVDGWEQRREELKAERQAILEFEKDICKNASPCALVDWVDCDKKADCGKVRNQAKVLYRLGYRKLPEGSVIITKEQKAEIERLTKEKETAWRKFKEKCNESIELSMMLGKRLTERAELQKQVDELTEKLGKVLLGVKADELLVAKGVEQAVKDTAKEIFTDLLKEFSIRKSCGNADVVVREMASRKGVEVE